MGFSSPPPPPPHDQFPQPTRPRFAADPDQVSDDELIINRPVHHSIHHPPVTIDLPKTKTKIEDNTQHLLLTSAATDHHEPPPPPPPPACYPTMESSSSSSSSSSSAGNRVVHLSPSIGKTPKGEKEAVDELLHILVDCLDELSTRNREIILLNFFSEVERDERLEKFIVERMKQSKVKALTELYEKIPPQTKAEVDVIGDEMPHMSRSVVESAEELTEKLERFKMKTLDFEEEPEEDVKQEDKEKSQTKPTK